MKALVDLLLLEQKKVFCSAQVKAVVHPESNVWTPEAVEDRLRSSIKARSKDNSVLLVVNLGTLTCAEYSCIMFIPAKKRILKRLQQANIAW